MFNRRLLPLPPFYVVRRTWSQRLQHARQTLITMIYDKLFQLNMFPARNFTNHLDRDTIQTLGKWSTRFYFLLITVTFVFIAFYMVIRPELLIKQYNTPSIDLYKELADEFGDKLQCPCSLISLPFRDFVTLEANFHQVKQKNQNRNDSQIFSSHKFFSLFYDRFVLVFSFPLSGA